MKGKPIVAWGLVALIAAAIAGAVAVQLAVARNGPAVLSAVDRITGGAAGAERMAMVPTGAHPQQKLIVWGPVDRNPEDRPLPVLIFVHGGSWRSGDPADYGFIGRAFVAEGFLVVLAGYRLGEDGIYPAMFEDTARAVAWVREEVAGFGGDPTQIVIAGHSAGAYNAVMVALEEQWIGRRGLPADTISGVVGLSGPYDFLPFDSDSTKDSFGHVENPPTTQPVSHVRADAPPMLLIHGELDTLVKPDNTRTLVQRLKQGGAAVKAVFFPDMKHNDPLIRLAAPWRGTGRNVAQEIVEFARDATGSANKHTQTSVPVKPETR